jgi:hypothetical protein
MQIQQWGALVAPLFFAMNFLLTTIASQHSRLARVRKPLVRFAPPNQRMARTGIQDGLPGYGRTQARRDQVLFATTVNRRVITVGVDVVCKFYGHRARPSASASHSCISCAAAFDRGATKSNSFG